MFYKTFLGHVGGWLFLAMGIALVALGIGGRELKSSFFPPLSEKGAYFYALVKAREDYNFIAQKLRRLPGIDGVKTISSHILQAKAKEILDPINVELSTPLTTFNFTALKVIFSPQLQERSQKLIREYLLRLGGQSLTLGATKGISNSGVKKEKDGFYLLQEYGVYGAFVVGILLWFLWGNSYLLTMEQEAYLIENFQRRKGVALKSKVFGFASIFFGGVFLSWSVFGTVLSWETLWGLSPFALFCFPRRKVSWPS